jgi:hypothetical protein
VCRPGRALAARPDYLYASGSRQIVDRTGAVIDGGRITDTCDDDPLSAHLPPGERANASATRPR